VGKEELLHLLFLESAHVVEHHCLFLLLAKHALLHSELLLHCFSLLVLLQKGLQSLQVEMLAD
jgi:hypothetical protein